MDLKGERESKNFVDHTNYINKAHQPVTPDVDLFWRMMREGKGEDNYISHITNPNVDPTSPPLDARQVNPNDLLSALLLHLLQRG